MDVNAIEDVTSEWSIKALLAPSAVSALLPCFLQVSHESGDCAGESQLLSEGGVRHQQLCRYTQNSNSIHWTYMTAERLWNAEEETSNE